DDVLISVERPLSIDTAAQMVASILSKKKAAGSTHLVLDIPVGPKVKVKGAELGRGRVRSLGLDDGLHLGERHARLQQLPRPRLAPTPGQGRIEFEDAAGELHRL
ncbi:hypothetical protein, partial [Staphylococcus aureus]|uniref:hypothetical protein n=1 Tax=Staphylococcus aureus TaxID=1280 RepID=UPI0019159202